MLGWWPSACCPPSAPGQLDRRAVDLRRPALAPVLPAHARRCHRPRSGPRPSIGVSRWSSPPRLDRCRATTTSLRLPFPRVAGPVHPRLQRRKTMAGARSPWTRTRRTCSVTSVAGNPRGAPSNCSTPRPSEIQAGAPARISSATGGSTTVEFFGDLVQAAAVVSDADEGADVALETGRVPRPALTSARDGTCRAGPFRSSTSRPAGLAVEPVCPAGRPAVDMVANAAFRTGPRDRRHGPRLRQ